MITKPKYGEVSASNMDAISKRLLLVEFYASNLDEALDLANARITELEAKLGPATPDPKTPAAK